MRIILRAALILAALYALAVGAIALNQRALIYHPHSEVVAPDIDGVEAVTLETPDGERLVAWWRAPPEGGPVFLFFDGNAGQPQRWGDRWEKIIDGGAGFLAVYYRGFSGSTGHPSEQGLYTDARAGYDWLIAHGFAPRDIVIHGLSLGSGVATHLASERPARALILEAPFTSVVDAARERMPWLPGFVVSERFMSREAIRRVRMPVLIAHGDADSTIPFHEGQALFALANEPKRFERFPGGEHITLTDEGLYERIWPFLAAYPSQ